MDFTGKKNAKKAEEILKKHFEHHGCISGNNSRFQDVLIQTDAEIDLLSENDNEPAVRPFTMEELEQLDKVHEDECELAFESVNDLFPALERNGRALKYVTTWTGISMTKPQTSLPVIQPHSKYKKNI